MKRAIVAIAVATAVLLLSGCVAGEDGDVAPTAPRYSSLEELRQAYADLGFSCSEFDQSEGISYAQDSGRCAGDWSTLSIFKDEDAVANFVQRLRSYNESTGIEARVATGANWAIWSDHASQVTENLGGELHIFKE